MFFPTNPSPSPHSARGSATEKAFFGAEMVLRGGFATVLALFGAELPAERGSATKSAFFGAE